MKKEKAKHTEAKVRTPVEELTGEETMVHYNAIQLEEIRSTMHLILEATSTALAEMQRQIDEERINIRRQLETISAVIGQQQRQLDVLQEARHQLWERMDTAAAEHKREIDDLRRRFEESHREIRERFETSVRALREKVDRHGTLPASHEARISSLEA